MNVLMYKCIHAWHMYTRVCTDICINKYTCYTQLTCTMHKLECYICTLRHFLYFGSHQHIRIPISTPVNVPSASRLQGVIQNSPSMVFYSRVYTYLYAYVRFFSVILSRSFTFNFSWFCDDRRVGTHEQVGDYLILL